MIDSSVQSFRQIFETFGTRNFYAFFVHLVHCYRRVSNDVAQRASFYIGCFSTNRNQFEKVTAKRLLIASSHF